MNYLYLLNQTNTMKIITSIIFCLILFSCSDKENINSGDSPSGTANWMLGSDSGKPLKNYTFDNGNKTLVSAAINKMVQYDNELYVGGDFEVIGGEIIPYLAKWDGLKWSSVGSISGPVKELIVFNNKLYFQVKTEIENQEVNELFSWDGNNLTQENIVVGAKQRFIEPRSAKNENEKWTVHDNKLFLYVRDAPPSSWDDNALVWFDGKSWFTDADFNFHHGVLTSFQGKLYATISDMGGYPGTLGFYRFNGDFDNPQASQGWENVAGVTLQEPRIRTVVEFENKLIVGGPFETMGGKQFNSIASFDGKDWSAFSSWGDSPYELKVFNNKLYGSFPYGRWSGMDYERIVVYTNGGWKSLTYNLTDFDIISDGIENTLELYNGFLYFGGNGTVGGTDNFLKLKQ